VLFPLKKVQIDHLINPLEFKRGLRSPILEERASECNILDGYILDSDGKCIGNTKHKCGLSAVNCPTVYCEEGRKCNSCVSGKCYKLLKLDGFPATCRNVEKACDVKFVCSSFACNCEEGSGCVVA
jgi:hypothetical protein